MSYPSALVTDYRYTSLGYLCRLTDNAGSATCTTSTGGNQVFWTVNARDAELHPTQQTTGGGTVIHQSYDAQTGLPTCAYTGAGCTSTGTVASLGYVFDTIGNLTARTDSNEGYTERFCYDALNRLTNDALGASCTASGTVTVSYDTIGNITEKTDTCATANCYAYPSSGPTSVRPHAVSSITGTVDGLANPLYQYDANGNLTCAATTGGCTGTIGRQETLTSFNMAATVTQGATSLTLAYGADHDRVTQAATISGTTTTTSYLPDSGSGVLSLREVTGGTPTTVDYLTLDGQIVAQRTVGQVAPLWGAVNWNGFTWTASAAASWDYFVLDHLGSVAVVTDGSGAVVQRLSYDAWGKARNPNGTAAACGAISSYPTTRGYTNQERMPAQCLVNLNARIYDPSIAKFMAPDPVTANAYDPQSLNRYAYVDNRPLSMTDVTGLLACGEVELVEGVETADTCAAAPQIDAGPFAFPPSPTIGPPSAPAIAPQQKSAPISNAPSGRQTACMAGGFAAGTAIGAALGTVIEPGGGTAALGWAGGELGSALGAAGILGGGILCSNSSGSGAGSAGGQPADQNLVKVPSNKGANQVAQEHGYGGAEDAKEGLGRGWDIYRDKTTGKYWIWNGRPGSEKLPL